MHATEFIQKNISDAAAVIALIGNQRTLKLSIIELVSKHVLGPEDSATRFAGREATLKNVRDELLTISMWGERRLVIVEDADEFVSANRSALEKYVESPAKKSVLILDVATMPKSTRLFKLISAKGQTLDCSELKGDALNKWIQNTASRLYEKKIASDVCQLLVQLAGPGLGQLEQELSKLASYVGDLPVIDGEAVRKLVGGWPAETTWAMTDAVKAGRLKDALTALANLLNSGENAHRTFGGISFVFRKMVVATELARQGVPLKTALHQAGCFPGEVAPATEYLRRIGRPKAELISSLLLETETSLKGGSRMSDRSQLELLLTRLSGVV